jgi:hypothetical protein
MPAAPNVWGPILWSLLHTIGARAGLSSPKIYIDELRELRWLVDHLESIIPCKECRDHVQEYRRANPLPVAASAYGLWFWTFHEEVNRRLGKPSTIPFTPELGKPTDNRKLLETWKAYTNVLSDSLLKGQVKGENIKEFNRHFRMWIGFSA